MANRNKHRPWSMTRGHTTIQLLIKIVGAASAANNVVTVDAGGEGVASVARTNTGEYTITLQDKWFKLVGFSLDFMAATAIDLVPQLVSHDVSAKTVVLKTLAAATATDTANGVTHYISVALELKDSAIK